MYKVRDFFLAVSAVLFFAGAAAAADNVLLALNPPVKQDALKLSTGLTEPATPQARISAGYGDYDAFSVTDPLYREGSKEMLKQVLKESEAPKAVKPVLRDAPISKPAKALKKPRVKKPVHTDPVKGKSTI